MPSFKNIFLEDSKIAFDKKHRRTINFNISKYDEAVKKGKLRYIKIDLAKERASYLKEKVVANLAGYLQQFEKMQLITTSMWFGLETETRQFQKS